eukprot:Opistho-1_new@97733
MGKNDLHKAAKDGDVDKIKKLLKGGLFAKKADVSTTDDHSWTPLHYAAYEGHVDAIHLLVAHGCDVHARTIDGELALHLAAKKGGVPACKALIEHGSPILSTDNNGWTPRVAAEKVEQKDTVRYLENEEKFAER